MNFELQQIKKNYGERMAHLCRTFFSTILEEKGKLLEILESHFEPNRYLYDDLEKYDSIEEFREYINSLYSKNNEVLIDTGKTPEELLDEAGYYFYECESESDIQYFKKYYQKGEELCTFTQGGRLDTDYVFFAVKKNVDYIVREDFDAPQREDLYGTSVISIQFSRGLVNTLSIKNRYNHTVENPDATFGNNLEKIIPGLTRSFEKKYNFNIKQDNISIYLPGYKKVDEKYYKYNYEINDVYYCIDNLIIDNGEVVRDYQKDGRYFIVDYFLIDFKDKKITTYDDYFKDGFPDTVHDIKNIEVTRINKDERNIKFKGEDNNSFNIVIDDQNLIKAYYNDNIEVIPPRFFHSNIYMERMSIQNAKIINSEFCLKNKFMKTLLLDNAEEIDSFFLSENRCLEELIANKVKKVGNYCLNNNVVCKRAELQAVERIGSYYFSRNRSISKVDYSNLLSVGNYFLTSDENLETAILKKLEITKEGFLTNAQVKILDASNIRVTDSGFMTNDKAIEVVDLHNLERATDGLLTCAKNLREADLSNLRYVGNDCLKMAKIKRFDAPHLEIAGNNLLSEAYDLQVFNANNMVKAGNNLLAETEQLKVIQCDALKETGSSCLRYNEIVEEALFSNLLITGSGFLESAYKLRNFDAHNLRVIGVDSLKEYPVKPTELPNLLRVVDYNNNEVYDTTSKFYFIIKRNQYKNDLYSNNDFSEVKNKLRRAG